MKAILVLSVVPVQIACTKQIKNGVSLNIIIQRTNAVTLPAPDIGYSHITDYHLYHELMALLAIPRFRNPELWPRHPSRYVDGEEEAEGIYR